MDQQASLDEYVHRVSERERKKERKKNSISEKHFFVLPLFLRHWGKGGEGITAHTNRIRNLGALFVS